MIPSKQTINWVNAQQQTMPVVYMLKKDEPTTGLEAANMQRVVRYAQDAFPTAKFPGNSSIAVFKNPDNVKEIDAILTTPRDSYYFEATHKKEENALSALFTKMGRYLRDNNLPSFAGKGVSVARPPQPKALSYTA